MDEIVNHAAHFYTHLKSHRETDRQTDRQMAARTHHFDTQADIN